MAETRTVVTVNGSPLSPHQLDVVQSVNVREALGSQDMVSIAIAMDTDTRSGWTSPLDALVAPATPFTVALSRGGGGYSVDARSVSASWSFQPGGVSTLTVEGMDRSVEMDRRTVRRLWQDTTDATIAETLFGEYGLAARADTTPQGASSDVYSPQQWATDWAFLTSLAGRNGFDVRVESVNGTPTGIFGKVDPTADPQATLSLGYGALGGAANASVQLLAGHEVHLTRTVPGTMDTDAASDAGTGNAMGTRSLGGARVLHTRSAGDVSAVDSQSAATALAERSAFGATLTVTLTQPDAPLLRARRTVSVAGLGEALNGRWLVQSVAHTVTQGGHTQQVSLVRNALGDQGAAGALGVLGALAAAGAAAL